MTACVITDILCSHGCALESWLGSSVAVLIFFVKKSLLLLVFGRSLAEAIFLEVQDPTGVFAKVTCETLVLVFPEESSTPEVACDSEKHHFRHPKIVQKSTKIANLIQPKAPT